MFSKYNYNEGLKRFEPKEKRCGYCFQNEGKDINNYNFIRLYKENSRTNFVIYRSLKYEEISIGIARCNDCAKFHEELSSKSPIIRYAIYTLILIFVLPVFGLKVFIIGIILSLCLFYLSHKYWNKKDNTKKERYTLKEGNALNETIQDLVISGWTFNKPSA